MAASWACDLGGWDRPSYAWAWSSVPSVFPLRRYGPDVVDPAVDQPSRVPGWGQGRMAVSGQITAWAESACPLQGSHVRLGKRSDAGAPSGPGWVGGHDESASCQPSAGDAERVLVGSCPIADAYRTAPRYWE